jgi:hypothetical protein
MAETLENGPVAETAGKKKLDAVALKKIDYILDFLDAAVEKQPYPGILPQTVRRANLVIHARIGREVLRDANVQPPPEDACIGLFAWTENDLLLWYGRALDYKMKQMLASGEEFNFDAALTATWPASR